MHFGDMKDVLPATKAQVDRLRKAIKDMNPNDSAEIDAGSLMALIKRIDLDHSK